jgi:hypothetical protein
VSWSHVGWDDAASRIVRSPQAKLKARVGPLGGKLRDK